MKAILSSLLFAVAASASAHDCQCPNMPSPPAPPEAPAAPMPPAPPAPPPMPAIPSGAHAACAGKAAGTQVRYVIKKGEVMTGSCASEGGKQIFALQSYSLED